jgi:hypothetical protein
MKFSRPLVLALVAAGAFVAVSCSDLGAPTAPAVSRISSRTSSPTSSTTSSTALTPRPGAPEADLIGSLTGSLTNTVQGILLKCTPMPEYTATQVIGPAGGTMVIGPHTFTVPRGALSSTVTITADAPHDNLNRIVFGPQGLTFSTPASLTMSYANCQGLGSLLPKRIAYTNDLLQILSFLTSIDNIFTHKVTGQVNHFSEYAIAW